MNWSKYVICAILLAIMQVSCSETTLEDDAKNAAELVNRSNQYAIENDVNKAGKTYAEAQEIIRKYRHKPNFEKFYEIYSSFLDINTYNEIDPNISNESSSEN